MVRSAVAASVRMEVEESRGDIVAESLSPWFSLRRRFRASLYKRVASAFTYVTMWGWAVALLGSLPSEEFWEDLLSVLALSVAFALTAGLDAYHTSPMLFISLTCAYVPGIPGIWI